MTEDFIVDICECEHKASDHGYAIDGFKSSCKTCACLPYKFSYNMKYSEYQERNTVGVGSS